MTFDFMVVFVVILLLIDIPTPYKVGLFLGAVLIWKGPLEGLAADKENVSINMKELCTGPCTSEVHDEFNTYQAGDYNLDMQNEAAAYRSQMEYPSELTEQIAPVFSNHYTDNADDSCARQQRFMQERSRESIENRARVNPNTFRMYFAEEQETAENAPWWGVDQDKWFD